MRSILPSLLAFIAVALIVGLFFWIDSFFAAQSSKLVTLQSEFSIVKAELSSLQTKFANTAFPIASATFWSERDVTWDTPKINSQCEWYPDRGKPSGFGVVKAIYNGESADKSSGDYFVYLDKEIDKNSIIILNYSN